MPIDTDTPSGTGTQQAILVVDDDQAVRQLLRQCFEAEGYLVLEAGTGEKMFEQLRANNVDLVTLDLSLGSEDGIDLARTLRMESNVAIVMVSARAELIDTVVGLEVGADDYIAKPFQLREVLARVRSVLRRAAVGTAQEAPVESDSGYYEFEGWRLNPATRELLDENGAIVYLTTGEYEMLEVLVTHSQQVLSRDQIMNLMRGCDWHPNDRTIDNHIARLRKKLNTSIDPAQLIKTVRGSGYLFTARVNKVKGVSV